MGDIIKKILFIIFIGILSIGIFTCIMSAKAFKKTKEVYIYLDPGHGGYDGGCTSKDKTIIEKDITLKITILLANYLRQTGYKVSLTRSKDEAISENKAEDIHKRVELINNSHATLYISIHANSFPSNTVKGAQVFYKNSSENKILASIIMKKLQILDSTNHREPLVIKDKYLVDNIDIPGCLIEVGFLTNENDLNNLIMPTYQEDLAFTVYLGIIEYLDYFK